MAPATMIAASTAAALPSIQPFTTTFTPRRRLLLLPRATSSSPPSSPPPPSQLLTLLTSIPTLLWGPSTLPPKPLISFTRTLWSTTWHLLMSRLAPSDPTTGHYSRPSSQFRYPSSSSPSPVPPLTSLRLFVAFPCPWAHRTLIVHSLKALPIPVSVASPGVDGDWVLGRDDHDGGGGTVREVYGTRKGGFVGRATVPMLWDVERKEVVCNESYDIIRLFNGVAAAGEEEETGLDLEPVELKEKIEEWNRVIYPNVNNGVYRCGFAQSQEAYDAAVNNLFGTLDMLEEHLGSSRYLCGDVLTLADVCLFTTLVRFDLVYNVLFKCTKKKLLEYPNLHGYTRDIYQIPKVAETCNFEAIMDGYYRILFPLNPGGICPVMPAGCGHEALSRSHNRESLSSSEKRLEASLLHV